MAIAQARKMLPAHRTVRRTNEERSTETQKKLIKAAIQVLHEIGYSGLTIAKVAHRAGLTSGAMQHHFKSKVDLLLGILENTYPVLDIPIERIVETHGDAKGRLFALIDRLWKIYRRPEYLVIWEVALGTRSDPEVSKIVRASQQDVSSRMAKAVPNLLHDTGLSDERIKRIWNLITNTLRGLALLSVFGSKLIQDADLDTLKEAVADLLEKPQPKKTRK